MGREAQNSNLIVPTSEQARKNGRKGGLKSAKVKAEKKSLRNALQTLLDGNYEVEGKKVTGYDLMALGLFDKAKLGDVAAFNSLRDTVGEKPIEKKEIDNKMDANINFNLKIVK